MSNVANIFIPMYIWIGIVTFIGFLITIIGFFLTKYFKDTKEKFDILFKRQRHMEMFLAHKFNYKNDE